MVRYLDANHNLLPENTFAPIGAIYIGNFWFVCDPRLFVPPYNDPLAIRANALYSGPFLTVHDPQYNQAPDLKLYDIANARPIQNSVALMDDTGILYLPPGVEYSIAPPTGSEYHTSYNRYLVITLATQTGDVPTVAAALANDPLLDVLIIIQTGKGEVGENAATAYRNSIRRDVLQRNQQPYESLYNFNDRIKKLLLTPEQSPEFLEYYNGLLPALKGDGGEDFSPLGRARWHDQDDAHYFFPLWKSWTYENGNRGRAEYVSMTVGGCTEYLAQCYGPAVHGRAITPQADQFLKTNDDRLSSPWLSKEALIQWVATLTPPLLHLELGTPRMSFVLLWSRYSGGFEGGYNPAADSDVKGQAQLIVLAHKLRLPVITMGQEVDAWGHPTPKGDLHLGEFWRTGPFIREGLPTNSGRPGQTCFYSLLLERQNVIQVGQKTGGMDSGTLIGVPTIYMEDIASPSFDRLQKWSRVMRHYKCAAISTPPSGLGKALRKVQQQYGYADRDGNLTKAKELWEKDPQTYYSGYADKDLPIIKDQITDMIQNYYIFDRK